MALAEDVRTLDNPGSGGTNHNFTHTINSGTDLGLQVVAYGYQSSGAVGDVTSIHWDTAGVNEALTKVRTDTYEFATNRNLIVSVWRLENPTAGATKNIQVVWSASQNRFAAVAQSFTDCNQTEAIDTTSHGTAQSNSQAPSVSGTTDQDDSWWFGGFGVATRLWGGTMTPDDVEDEDFATGGSGGDRSFWLGHEVTTTAGSYATGASTTQSANDWVMSGWEVRQESGGGGPSTAIKDIIFGGGVIPFAR